MLNVHDDYITSSNGSMKTQCLPSSNLDNILFFIMLQFYKNKVLIDVCVAQQLSRVPRQLLQEKEIEMTFYFCFIFFPSHN